MNNQQVRRWLIGTWARFLVPFHFRQEGFHGGRQCLAVWRWGNLTWEIYDYGSNVGHDALDRLLSPLKIGTPKCYSRIQNLCAAGRCRLIGRFSEWAEARAAR